MCAVKKSFDCVNCQNEILIVSESVKDEPLSCGDKEAAGSSDILWRGTFISTLLQMLHHTKPDNINTVINQLENPVLMSILTIDTNLLHDELLLHD